MPADRQNLPAIAEPLQAQVIDGDIVVTGDAKAFSMTPEAAARTAENLWAACAQAGAQKA